MQKCIPKLSWFFFLRNLPSVKPSLAKSMWKVPEKGDVEKYSEPSWTSKMELFPKTVKDVLYCLLFWQKAPSYSYVWLGSEYVPLGCSIIHEQKGLQLH